MNRNSLLASSGIALLALAIWWLFTVSVDGLVLGAVPYDRYETIALLYPEVYYPALPGWIVAHAQPFSWGVWVVTGAWLLALSVAIGAAATRLARHRNASAPLAAVSLVVGLFVAVTVLEAAATFSA